MRRLALAAALMLALAGCGISIDSQATAPTTTLPPGLPKVTVTPGVVITTSAADVCTPGWASKHRHGLTATQKATILKAYGYSAGQHIAEWDHLVSLELGGGNGTKNVWPQIDPAQTHRKDRLEGKLRQQVCTGRLALPEAQVEIRQFWLYW